MWSTMLVVRIYGLYYWIRENIVAISKGGNLDYINIKKLIPVFKISTPYLILTNEALQFLWEVPMVTYELNIPQVQGVGMCEW